MSSQKKKNDHGRPTKYKPEFDEMLVKHCSHGGTYEGFAGELGVCVKTLYNWEQDHPSFLQAKRRARAANRLMMDNIGMGLMTGKLKGSSSVWIFVMKNLHGLRDDPVDDIEEIEGLDFV